MDDILYLRKHADEESFLFVVDSSKRDTAVFPQANEYEVSFHAPFRNVVGMDLIDATIPRTEYLVEARTCTLSYTYAGTKYAAQVDPGDYTLLQLVAALNRVLEPRLRVEVTSTPPEITNKVRLVGEAPFTVHVSESTLRKALGLGVGASLVATSEPGILGARTIVQGPLPALTAAAMQPPVRQSFACPATGTVTEVSVYVRSQAAVAVQVAIVNTANQLVGEGSVVTTAADFEQLVVPLSAAVLPGTYHVVLNSAASVFCGGPTPSRAVGGTVGGLWGKYASWTSGTDAMCLDIKMEVDGYVLRPPCVANLTGEPFVLVRCPEVESQLYRDRAFESVHAGMGLVKLANYGFREQRFDFASFPPRKLPTPIAKLGKLTIRLEKSDGTLYDTKGVDHHLILAIKYLELNKGPEAMTSTLNPSYTPNPLHYLQTRQSKNLLQ